MQKHTLVFFVLIATLLVLGCKKPIKKFSATRIDPASQNFSYLDKALKDVKIVALGESSHGFGTMHSLKGEMIKYLHKNRGFNLIIFESGYADVSLAWQHFDQGKASQLMGGMLPSNLRSEQMLPLINYFKENKVNEEAKQPLEVGGMDTKRSGEAFKFKLMFVIKRLEPKIIQDSITKGMLAYDRSFEFLDDEFIWTANMNAYTGALNLAKDILVDNKEDIGELELATEKEYAILTSAIDMMLQSVDYEFGETYTRGLTLRDSLMAENVNAYLKAFPNSKVIIWGHNGHIEKGPGEGDKIKWLGHYLKEQYGNAYYAMGMYAKKGMIYQTTERKASNFDISYPEFIESKIDADYGKDAFLDLPIYDVANTSWINNLINGYELEAGGKVRFIPTKRFDGVILLGETDAPIYMSNEGTRRK